MPQGLYTSQGEKGKLCLLAPSLRTWYNREPYGGHWGMFVPERAGGEEPQDPIKWEIYLNGWVYTPELYFALKALKDGG